MLVPCCLTSLLHFKYMSVSSNESDMRAQAKANAMTFKAPRPNITDAWQWQHSVNNCKTWR